MWRAINSIELYEALQPSLDVVMQLRRQFGFHDGSSAWHDFDFEELFPELASSSANGGGVNHASRE